MGVGSEVVVCVDFDEDVVDVDVGLEDEAVDAGVDFDDVVDVGLEDVVEVGFDDFVDVDVGWRFDDVEDAGVDFDDDDVVDAGFDDVVDVGFDDDVDVGVDVVDVGVDDDVDVGIVDVDVGVVDDIGFESSLVYVFEVRDDDSLWESDDETAAMLSFAEIGGSFSFSEQPHNSDAQTASDVIDINIFLLIKFTPYHTI